eukprot:CAMPEP_0182453936 /NCGR_PEP_ID=MMETSP1319-20130603/781_1 /TAXON_ID=172717 /ORGANISM="Bolidomonas pacifica, Strain RCC208" /LENGTH=386 /DNA_ID=CAMNT_0024651897 /DNA_START=158 /DNA_END=1314 /DNA_ORIENTATION=-
MSFPSIPPRPADAVFALNKEYNLDPSPLKISCGVGAYRDAEGRPLVLRAVKEAKERLLDSDPGNEYLPIEGDAEFLRLSRELCFGSDPSGVQSVQSLSGTGALYLVHRLFATYGSTKKVYFSDPTWGNHKAMALAAGLEPGTYTYLDSRDPCKPAFDLKGMLASMDAMPPGSMIVLQACGHNPTGVDPSPSEWDAVVSKCGEKGLVVCMDNAYQGFATGSPDDDRLAMEKFLASGQEFFVCCSYAKNFGLYGQRVGACHVVSPNAADVVSQLKGVARTTYSNPPKHGSDVVKTVLGDERLRKEWVDELGEMAGRIRDMRAKLRAGLESSLPGTSWSHVTSQIGMFSYTGLTPAEVERCKRESVYMLSTGRVSVAGINEGNLERIVG